jgi:Bacterial protein of unknown function (DUF885)
VIAYSSNMRVALLCILATFSLRAQSSQPAWVARSNQNAELLLDVMARYSPEEAGRFGILGLDEKISTPSLEEAELERRDTAKAVDTLRSQLASEKDPSVHQDLEILIKAGEQGIRASKAYENHTLPYVNAAGVVFSGIHALLDDQIPADRRRAAVIRLRKYTGIEPDFQPITTRLENIYRGKAKDTSLLGPPKAQVEQDLTTINDYVKGVGELFQKYKLTGYEDGFSKLKDEIDEYKKFIQTEVLPRARTDFRLPPELYAINLDNVGVDYTPEQLTTLAHKTFVEIQEQMKEVAERVSRERGLPSADYRDVIKALKKNQLRSDEVMPTYHQTLLRIEDIIRREHLVTLPDRPCVLRVASAAETAQQPAPHYQPPPLIGNHGEQGQFVLPGGTVGPDGKPLQYDDFTFPASSWTLTAHEARPGHDLQFSSIAQHGVSQARAIFAFNSTNVEGWALYAEWFMLPYMPDEGKLISLQLRLLRAARAFLDPELQQGKVTRDQALHVLQTDVVLSPAFATEEVDRFTFRNPGQAVSYFDGYTRLLEIRAEAERTLGPRFDAGRFHDFILAQGLLPPSLLRKAVMDNFVAAEKGERVVQ